MSRIARDAPFSEKGHCGWCNAPLSGRRTRWCSDACVNEWMIRHDPGWAASKVRRRDHGVCALCGVDTERQRKAFERIAYWRAPKFSVWSARSKPGYHRLAQLAMQKYGVPYSRLLGNRWWDCDHIVPVIEGGGGCGLDNLRTLCIPCHRDETARLVRRLADNRKGQQPLDFGATA